MYAVLAKESLNRHLFKHWINNGWQSLSLSLELHAHLLIQWSLCTCVYRWRKWHCKWSHSSSLLIDVSWTKDSLQIYAPELWKWLLHNDIMCNGGLKLDVLCWTWVKRLTWLIMDIYLTCCCNVNSHIQYYISWFSGTLNNAFKYDG